MPTVLEKSRTVQKAELVPEGSTPAAVEKSAAERFLSLDAYRGFIMLMLISHGFGFSALSEHPTFASVAAQFEHVPWEGLVFWDLIQPAFMFMVGMAMPFAFANRRAKGESQSQIAQHVIWRAFLLIFLSQVLMSVSSGRLHFQLINVLSQIAFTYLLTFLIFQMSFRLQIAAAVLLLAGHWILFGAFPGPEGAFSKTGNIGARIDLALLGYNYNGYYVTINFITSTVTTLWGAWTAVLLMKKRSHAYNLSVIALSAVACLALGVALQPVNPMVKRLWTTSFTFYSTGWVLLMLLGFYWLIEVRKHRRLVFPLSVLGMNSIFIYAVSIVLYGWLDRAVAVFTGRFGFAGSLAPVFQATAVVLVMWYFCYWLYTRRIFFKV
jgi:predicted acyltransferase